MNRLFLPYNICIEYHQARINLFGNKNEHICLVTKKKKNTCPPLPHGADVDIQNC